MRFLVIGLDEFGAWLARELRVAGHQVVGVDTRGERVDAYREWVGKGLVANASRSDVLRELGAPDADAVVLTAVETVPSRMLSVLALRDVGARNVFVEVERPEELFAFETLGVRAIYPAREAAHRLARRLPRLGSDGTEAKGDVGP